MKQALTEVTMRNSLSLTESNGEKLHKGCLGTISGPCADFKNPTRNDNFYSRKLWENAFSNDLTKEALEDRVLIGELGHPLDGRLETDATKSTIVMTKYWFDDNKGLLMGSFDILATPCGKILKSLLDYGCKVGVSSRGEGDVTQRDGKNYVDESSFNFMGFDAVLLPAVKVAKPTLQESIQLKKKAKTFRESLQESIKSAHNKDELDLIKQVIDTTDLPDSDSLLESVNIKSQELEGITNSSNLSSDLEEAIRQNQELKKEIKRLKEEVATANSSDSQGNTESSEEVVDTDNSESELNEITEKYSDLVFESTSNSKKLEKVLGKYISLKRKIESLERVNSNLSESNKRLKEQVSEVNSKLTEALSEKSNSRKNLLSIKESGNKRIKGLTQKVRDLEEQVKLVNDENESLKSDLRESKSKVRDNHDKIKSLNSEVSKLNESLTKEQDNSKKLKTIQNELMTKLSESTANQNNLVREYAKQKSKDFGLNDKEILESIKPEDTIESVNTLIESVKDRKDRYSKLPMITDPNLVRVAKASVTNNKVSEEDQQTLNFLMGVYK